MTSFEQQVRVRAYHIWEGEGGVFGRAEDHWLRAEAEFVAKGGAEIDAAPLLTVQPASPATSDAPSPAKVLKTRAARASGAGARAVSAKADAAARAGETAPKAAAKSSASKASAAKPAAAKARSTKAAPRSNAASSAALH